jgi:GNAT superfamily N-acetyltransferase
MTARYDTHAIRLRSATERDLDELRALENADALEAWPFRPDFLDHELEHGRMILAEDDDIVGFAGAFVRHGMAYLADAFVRRDRLGEGIGRAVVSAVLDDHPVRLTHASSDPRAMPLYARLGMRPLTPLLYVVGKDPRVRGSAAEMEPTPLSPELVQLDARSSGRVREKDLAFLAKTPGGELYVDADRRGYGAVRFVGTDAYLGPIGAATEADMARTTVGLIRRAVERAERVHLALYGPHPALAALLDAGFRIADLDTFMASANDLFDPAAYAPSPELG